MALDHETTTPEAAAQLDRDNTPGPGLRDDWPDPADCVTETDLDSCEWDDLIHDSALRADRMLRGLSSWRST